jgi:GT2 family glycosyltransferase
MSAPPPDSPNRVPAPPLGRGEAVWTAGIVNHGSYEDLATCLESLLRQAMPPSSVCVYDTGLDPEKFEAVRKAHPLVQFECGANRGYAGGANRVLAESINRIPAPGFCLILNPDVVLDPDHARRLVDAMIERPEVAIAGGKLLRPGRETIDSAGIRFPRHGRPRDRGSEEPDRGQFDRREFVDAISGAAMMIRAPAIPDLRIEGQLFDEDFFAYHEDTDLCWRARRLGWKILYEPAAVAVHARGWQKPLRSQIDPAIRRHSFKNHYLQMVKNQTTRGFIANLPWLVTWEVLRLGFVLVRDRAMLGAYGEAWRATAGAWRKRRVIADRSRRCAR